nr:MalM family protein [Niveibacterium umoris]
MSAALAKAPDCCASLAALPYATLAEAGTRSLTISPSSPAYAFDSGKSFFAAYRIAELKRPAEIVVASQRSAEPGSTLQLWPDFRMLAFEPTLLVLDAQFRIRRRITADPPDSACATQARADVFAARVDLVEPPDAAAYLIVLTTADALARDGQQVCGVVRHGLSPVGALRVDVSRIEIDERQLHFRVPVSWHPGLRDAGGLGLLGSLVDESGWLWLGEKHLYFLTRHGDVLRPQLSLPYTALRLARSDATQHPAMLVVATEEAGKLRFEGFSAAPAARDALTTAAAWLGDQVPLGRIDEAVEISIADTLPVISVEPGSSGFLSRLSDAALVGGSLVALPCALCQTGVCTPEMLLSCAALFSTGAVAGGVVASGQELLARAQGRSQGPAEVPTHAAITLHKTPALDATSLRACLQAALSQGGAEPWRDQGITGHPHLKASAAPATPSMQLALEGIAFVPEGATPADVNELPVRLHLRGHWAWVRAGDATPRHLPLTWQSDVHPLRAWLGDSPPVLRDTLDTACRDIATQTIATAAAQWRRH